MNAVSSESVQNTVCEYSVSDAADSLSDVELCIRLCKAVCVWFEAVVRKNIPECCKGLGGQMSAVASPSWRHSSPMTAGCTQKTPAKVSDASIFCGISNKLK